MVKQIKVVLIFIICFSPLYAGDGSAPPTVTPYAMGAQYYVYLGEERELLINVQIWGQIQRPGMYSVPKTTDVIGLISFAGGPMEYANLGEVKLIRSNPHPEVFDIDLENYTKTGETELIPILKPGDTIIVPENVGRKLSKMVQAVSQIAIIVNVYYLLFGR